MTKGNPQKPAIVAAADQSFKAAVAEALNHVRDARRAVEVAGLQTLTDDERLHSNGKLRLKEPEAMVAVLDAIDVAPGVFGALAPHDHGVDPEAVETGPSRAAVARYQTLAPLVQALDQLVRDVGDDALVAASLAKDVTVPGYAILRANAPINARLKSAGKVALDFYGGFGLRRTQKNKRAARLAGKATRTTPSSK